MFRSSRSTLGPVLRQVLLGTARHQVARRAVRVFPPLAAYYRLQDVRRVVRLLRGR